MELPTWFVALVPVVSAVVGSLLTMLLQYRTDLRQARIRAEERAAELAEMRREKLSATLEKLMDELDQLFLLAARAAEQEDDLGIDLNDVLEDRVELRVSIRVKLRRLALESGHPELNAMFSEKWPDFEKHQEMFEIVRRIYEEVNQGDLRPVIHKGWSESSGIVCPKPLGPEANVPGLRHAQARQAPLTLPGDPTPRLVLRPPLGGRRASSTRRDTSPPQATPSCLRDGPTPEVLDERRLHRRGGPPSPLQTP